MSILYISADVSMEKLDVATATTAASRQVLGQFANAQAGWEQMAAQVDQVAQCQAMDKIHLILEPTGG